MRARLEVLAACAATAIGAFPAAASATTHPATAAKSCAGLPQHSAIPVVDAAHVVKPETTAYLAADLMRLRFAGDAAVVAATVPDLGGDDVASYARRLFDCWGIGDKDKDNGVLILVAMREHRVRIELGAGLAGRVPQERLDLALETMTAPLRAGDVGGALRAAAVAVAHDLGDKLPDTQHQVASTSGGTDQNGGGAVDDVSDIPGMALQPAPDQDPFDSPGDSSGSGMAALVPLLVVVGLLGTALRALLGATVDGATPGGSMWRGGFPRYGGWGGGTIFHGGGWHDTGSGGSFGSSGSASSGSSGNAGSSGGGGSFGGGSGGGGGASGSW